MATQAAPAKKTRGNGPLVISFVGSDNKEGKRVSDGAQVKVADKAGKSVVFSFDSLPVAIQKQLGIKALAKELDIYGRNGADDNGSNVLDLVKEKYSAFKDGILYSRAEGGKGGPGRSFDFDKWVQVAKLRQDIRVKNKVQDKNGKVVVAATEKQLESYRLKLEGMTPELRKAHTAEIAKSPIGKLALSQYMALQAKAAMDDDETGEDVDLF